MKIAASVYSDKKRPLKEVINDIQLHHVDLIHVDCNDDLSVFDDIKEIRKLTSIPIDLHIITTHPSKYYSLLKENPVEYLTFQYEDLKEPLVIPKEITGKKGLAIITPTPISVFNEYADFDFILIMATIPGQSGGQFDEINFKKIRQFKQLYPKKRIHVDGGVNAEVSFILRNLGVYSSVSGSYLFNSTSIGEALMNLTQREIDSQFKVKDFMQTREEMPLILHENISLNSILLSIEKSGLGFCLVENKERNFIGLISNADVRKGLLKHIDNFNNVQPDEIINKTPFYVTENTTVNEMIKQIKQQQFPISYLPVLNNNNKAVGIITFVNLIKGEL
jgi:pentose-5-phosphate-3-epimerase/CBS domain-containing protein